MSDCDPEKFINRDEELKRVLKRVSDLVKGKPFDPRERVFHFIGPSGIGKSCLLEKIRHELKGSQPECVPLLISLDALKEGKGGVVNDLLVKVHDEFCKCKDVVLKKDDGKGKHWFVNHILRRIDGKAHVFLLLLDEINVHPKKDIEEMEGYLLKRFLYDNTRAVLITAGRSHPLFTDFALCPQDLSNIFRIPVFDERKTSEQMESLKPGSKELVGKIHKLSSGVPGNTVKLVEHIVGNPPDIPDEAQAIRSLLEDIKTSNRIEERYIPMLEALSILPGFFPEDVVPLFQCHPQLAGDTWDERRVKEEFLKLKEIKIGPGGVVDWDREKKHWAMDERTRDLFERELQMRNPPELWESLHCTALKMYREWGKKYNSDTYRNKSNHHQQRLQSAGLDCSDLEG